MAHVCHQRADECRRQVRGGTGVVPRVSEAVGDSDELNGTDAAVPDGGGRAGEVGAHDRAQTVQLDAYSIRPRGRS